MELGGEVIQLEFSFMSTSLLELSSLVEGLLRVGEADESNFTQADPAPVMARLICTGPQQNGPLDGWGEATVAYIHLRYTFESKKSGLWQFLIIL